MGPVKTGAFEAAAAAMATGDASPHDYITAFANAIALFASPDISSEIFSHIPSLLVTQFGAARSELWLWDESSESAYLTNVAGQAGYHRRDYSNAGIGAVGRVLGGQKPLYNASLSSISDEYREFAATTGLSHVTAFPLVAGAKLIGVTASYSRTPESKDLLQWWELFSQVSAATLRQILSQQQDQKTISQLSLLFEATRLLDSTLDLAELLELILKIARSEVKADRGTVFLVDAAKKELWSIFAQNVEKQEIRLPFGRGVAGHVAGSGTVVNVRDAYTLEYFDPSFDLKFGYRTRSLLCLPIRHDSGQIVGVLQLLNQNTRGYFSAEDEAFLTGLSGHMALALENARHHRETFEAAREKQELKMAQGLQRSLVPDAAPVIPGFDMAMFTESSKDVGGDYYDFITMDPETLIVVMADVAEKGLEASLAMSNLQAELRGLTSTIHSIEGLVQELNRSICQEANPARHVSLLLALVDLRRNGLHYISAGHTPPVWVRGETGEAKVLKQCGPSIGIAREADYRRESVRLQPSDVLVCSADGIIRSANGKGEEYGMQRLSECVSKHYAQSAEDIIQAIKKDLREFCGDTKITDDRGIVVMRVMRDRPTA